MRAVDRVRACVREQKQKEEAKRRSKKKKEEAQQHGPQIKDQKPFVSARRTLGVGILNPGGTDVGGTIVQNYVCLEGVHVPLELRAALLCRDIGLNGDASLDGLDRDQVNANDQCPLAFRHCVLCNLHPVKSFKKKKKKKERASELVECSVDR